MNTKHIVPCSVWFKFDHVARCIVILKIEFGGTVLRVKQTGRACYERRGKIRKRVHYVKTRGGCRFRLAMDLVTLAWTLEGALNYLGDPLPLD